MICFSWLHFLLFYQLIHLPRVCGMHHAGAGLVSCLLNSWEAEQPWTCCFLFEAISPPPSFLDFPFPSLSFLSDAEHVGGDLLSLIHNPRNLLEPCCSFSSFYLRHQLPPLSEGHGPIHSKNTWFESQDLKCLTNIFEEEEKEDIWGGTEGWFSLTVYLCFILLVWCAGSEGCYDISHSLRDGGLHW